MSAEVDTLELEVFEVGKRVKKMKKKKKKKDTLLKWIKFVSLCPGFGKIFFPFFSYEPATGSPRVFLYQARKLGIRKKKKNGLVINQITESSEMHQFRWWSYIPAIKKLRYNTTSISMLTRVRHQYTGNGNRNFQIRYPQMLSAQLLFRLCYFPFEHFYSKI